MSKTRHDDTMNASSYPAKRRADHRQAESGSIIYFIFLAVALFAALNIAVTQMNRGGGEPLKNEIRALYAGDIIDFGRALRRTAQDLRINGVEETAISFDNNFLSGYDHTPAQPDTNKIFSTSGGGLTYITPDEDWLDSNYSSETLYGQWFFTGESCVEEIGTGMSPCTGGDTQELLAVLPFIKESLCITINERLSVTNPSGSPPVDAGNAWSATPVRFTGSYDDNESLAEGASTLPGGLMSACFEGSGTPPSGSYHFYQVLLAR